MLRSLVDRFRRKPTVVPAEDRLRLAYEPRLDGDADPGEVVWTWVPYEDDPKQGKDRPVLVIGYIGTRLAILPLTSKDHTNHDDCVALGRGAWDRGDRTSYVKLDRVLAVAPNKVRREGAVLDKPRFDEVLGELKAYAARHGSHRA